MTLPAHVLRAKGHLAATDFDHETHHALSLMSTSYGTGELALLKGWDWGKVSSAMEFNRCVRRIQEMEFEHV